MSRVHDLITRYCPDGVEYFQLGELLDYSQPGKYLVKSADYDDSFFTPVLTAGQTFILGYTDETEGIFRASQDSPVIIFDDFTTAFKWVDFDFKAKSSAMKILTPKPEVNLRYVWFAMQTIPYKPRDHARQWIGTYSQFRIPVPPLEVQREIVRILDKFTQLEADLEAELEARSLQFEHYRRLLLMPQPGNNESTLGSISLRVSSGGTPKAGSIEFYSQGTIPWLRTNEVRFNEIWDTQVKITERAVERTSAAWIPANCVIVAISGATAGRSAVNKIPLTTNQHCCNLQIDPSVAHYKFVYHWVASQYSALKALGRGARSDLNGALIRGFAISLPDLPEQERIAAQLDSFEALISDIGAGLPGEIAARRQQYEYYRDQLLTFKEAS